MLNIKDEVLATYVYMFSCYEYSKAINGGDIVSLFAMLNYFLIFVLYSSSCNFIFTNITLFWQHLFYYSKACLVRKKNYLQKKITSHF